MAYPIGVDVSKYNLGWNPDKAIKPIYFVIQRSGYGSQYGCYKDESFDVMNIQVQKIPVRGAYWYYSSWINWKKQADFFLNIIKDKNFHFFCIDYERAFNTLNARTIAEVSEFVKYIKAQTNKKCMIYYSPSIYNEFIYPFGYTNWLNQQDSWIAQYPYSLGEIPLATQPSMSSNIKTWKIWQMGGGDVNFTAGRHAGKNYGGGLEGIDLNYFNGTIDELYEWAEVFESPIDPPPVIPPIITDPPNTATITVTSLNVRSGYGTTFSVIGSLKKNDKIAIIEQQTVGGNVWGKFLMSSNNVYGYVCLRFGSVYYSSLVDFSGIPVTPPVIVVPPVIPPTEQKIFYGKFYYALPRYIFQGPAIIAASDAPKANHPNCLLDNTEMNFVSQLNHNNQRVMDLFTSKSVGPSKGYNDNGKLIYIPATWSGALINVLSKSNGWLKCENIDLSKTLPSILDINHEKTPHLVARMTTINIKNQFVDYPPLSDGSPSPWTILDDPLFSNNGEFWLPEEMFTNQVKMINSMNVRSTPNISNNIIGSLSISTIISIIAISIDSVNNIWGMFESGKWVCLKQGNKSLTSWDIK
jgi:GH25 family lysozyme M1 (1,4-beta-N-acetylmuramidase)